AYVIGGDGKRTVDVDARYKGLPGHKVAVLVSARDELLLDHPDVSRNTGRVLAQRLAAPVPDFKIVEPDTVLKFQAGNPYWTVMPHHQILERLEAERLVIIDLVEYTTHASGDRHVFKGLVAGRVNVAEKGSSNASHYAFSTAISSTFPENNTVGVLNADDRTIELGMLKVFSRDVTRLFAEYQIEQ
ncbi:MAG: hypothetical protein R3336_08665, partial [Phycisphaeraceae bacterium]|nr:hypothetical protein [Phycisphaeraceae bacterium]